MTTPLVSPIVVGRDPLLTTMADRLQRVRRGSGSVLFLAGEAGIGKTRLLGVVERRALAEGFVVARGLTYPRDLEVPAAPLLDLARSMAAVPPLADAGRALESRLRETGADQADAHRRRRLLILDVADLLCGLARAQPVLLSVEDLHWADDLTLEMIAAIAARVTAVPLLLAATYRSDELYPRLPMREWRSLLLARRQAEELQLERLSLGETATMASLLAGDGLPAPMSLVADLHRRSDGVPLHVEELMAAVRRGDERAGGVPETLEVAVVDRLARRSPAAQRAAHAGAVIGRSFDAELLAGVLGDASPPAPELAELVEHFLLIDAGGGRYDFRHALIRDAIHAHVPGPERRRLHARVADVALAGTSMLSDAALSIHLEEAGRADEAARIALRAARAAADVRSNREALGLYRRVLANLAPASSAIDRAPILAEAARAAMHVDENDVAAAWLIEARDALRSGGRVVDAASLAAPLAATRHLLGEPLETRVALLEAALQELVGATDPDAPRARSTLHGGLAAAYMLARRLDEGLAHGRAMTEAGARGLPEDLELERRTTVGALLVFSGQMDEGWGLLETAAEDATAAGREDLAARALRMLGSSASVLVEYERGERWLRRGIEYTDRVEQWNHRHYMAAHLAHVLWATGRTEEARGLAMQALADGRGGITTRITALHVLGYTALSAGDPDGAVQRLNEALTLGEQMDELQRISPAVWGLAEAALANADAAAALAWCRRGRDASVALADAAYLFPFAVTGVRAHLAAADPAGAAGWLASLAPVLERRAIPGTLPALTHAQGVLQLAAGSTARATEALAAAADRWHALGRSWEATGARLDLAACHLRANRPADAQRIAAAVLDEAGGGHAALATRAAKLAATARRRGGGAEPWAPLTAREFSVARRVMEGRTNRELAEDLGISPKTASAHVEHILAKLGLTRRAEIAAWASRIAAASDPDEIGGRLA